MDSVFWCNAVGLVLNIVGAGLMFWGSGRVSSKVIIYNKAHQEILDKQDKSRNCKIRLGMALLFIGFILQFSALLLG